MKTLGLQLPSLEGKVIIEAAHIYTYEAPGPEHMEGAKIGGVYADFLTTLGADVEKWLFIDNYNPLFEHKEEILDVEKYVKVLAQYSFKPDSLVYERNLVTRARNLLELLLKQGHAKEHPSGAIVLANGNVKLYDPSTQRYFCSLLDATLYTQKLSTATCITVLPLEYEQQQAATKMILKKLGFDTEAIHTVYYQTTTNHLSVGKQNVFAQTQSYHPRQSLSSALSLLALVRELGGAMAFTLEAPR